MEWHKTNDGTHTAKGEKKNEGQPAAKLKVFSRILVVEVTSKQP